MLKLILRRIKYYLIRLFRLKQGAKHIALGVVFGFFPCWYPTFGIGPLLSITLSRLVRGNVVAAIIAAALGSLIWLPLFVLNYYAGNTLKGIFTQNKQPLDIDIEDVEYTEPIEQINRFHDYGTDFLFGALFNSVFFSIISYFAVYFIFSKYRQAILERLNRTK